MQKIESLWKGRPLSQLTKEELMEAVELLAKRQQQQFEQHQHDLRILCL